MIKYALLFLCLAYSAPAFAECEPKLYIPPAAVTIKSEKAQVDIKTKKIARIYGSINKYNYKSFERDMIESAHLPGDRVILINSTGGFVYYGKKMIELIVKEQLTGTKIICYVENDASSMAFNFFTNCDIRLMHPDGNSLVHKVYYTPIDIKKEKKLSAKRLRELAEGLDKSDEVYRVANAAAMGLTLEDYDRFADSETTWLAKTLLDCKYLHDTIVIQK